MPGPLSTPNASKAMTPKELRERVENLMRGRVPMTGKTAKKHGR
jgi:hypothetical protein